MSRRVLELTDTCDDLVDWPLIGECANHMRESKVKMSLVVRSKNTHHAMARILPRHWIDLARKSGVPRFPQAMILLASGIDAALAGARETLLDGFPELLWKSISTGARRQAQTFLAGQ